MKYKASNNLKLLQIGSVYLILTSLCQLVLDPNCPLSTAVAGNTAFQHHVFKNLISFPSLSVSTIYFLLILMGHPVSTK
jgi:hypothetical protein